MLSQGFGADLEKILKATSVASREPATVVATTATLTKAVKRTFGPKAGRDATWGFLPELRTIASEGLHRAPATCRLDLVDVVGRDKMDALLEVLRSSNEKCLVFCNTVASCRAAAHSLEEAGFAHLSYHGELNSREREVSSGGADDDGSRRGAPRATTGSRRRRGATTGSRRRRGAPRATTGSRRRGASPRFAGRTFRETAPRRAGRSVHATRRPGAAAPPRRPAGEPQGV